MQLSVRIYEVFYLQLCCDGVFGSVEFHKGEGAEKTAYTDPCLWKGRERLHLLMLHRAKPSGTTIWYNVKSDMERFHMSEGGATVFPKGAR